MDTNRIIVIANTPDKFEANNKVYSSEGIIAILAARNYKGPKLIAIKSKISREHKS